MFRFYREALFDYTTYLNLDSVNHSDIKNYLEINNEQELLKEKIVVELNNISQAAYYNQKKSTLKKLMKIKKRAREDKLQKHDIDEIQKIQFDTMKLEHFLHKYFANKEKFSCLRKKIELAIDNYSYAFFLNNDSFQKMIYETNLKASNQILHETKYNKKSYKKNRFSYVQRNILKTNSLSYTGITCFEKYSYEKAGIHNSPIINSYFINALLTLMFAHPKYRNYIKFKFSPIVIRDKYLCYLQRKQYIIPKYNSFHIRENLLFSEFYNRNLNIIQNKNSLQSIEKLIGKERLDFFIKQNLISIDFSKYDKEAILELLEQIPELHLIRDKIQKNNSYLDCNITYLKELFSSSKINRKSDLINVVYYSPAFTNYISKYLDSEKENISSANINMNNIEHLVVENPKYKKYVSELLNLKEKYPYKSLLDLLFDLEGKIIYQEDYWKPIDKQKSEVKIPTKKSLSLFYNINDQEDIFFNNIFPGDGFLIGREFKKMSHRALDNIDTHLKSIYGKNKEIYELVIDNEISNNTNTGNSPYNKIYWPDDLKEISVHEKKGYLNLKYKDKEINLIYFGSIPPHFFTGVKGLLLQVISPWIMSDNNRFKLQKINNRKRYSISYNDIKSLISPQKTDTLINVVDFFKNNNLPIKFFLNVENSFYKKPIFITLLNIDSINIFIEYIKKYNVTIEEQNPNISNLRTQKKLTEFIEFITSEDIKYVD